MNVFPIPIWGAPYKLLSVIEFPVLYATPWLSNFFEVLGLGASIYVELIVSTSYPFTNALPGETWYSARSSDANVPPCVNWPSLYIPPF